MHRIDKLLMKVDTITRLNDREIDLMNPRMTVTTTLNNVMKTLLDDWPHDISEAEADRLLPILVDYFKIEGDLRLSRPHLEWAIREGYEALVPILVVRHLMRDRNLTVNIAHSSKIVWKEFIARYRTLLNRLDAALCLATIP